MKVEDIFKPRGGMSQTAVLTLLGIHSTKNEEFLFWMLYIWPSTSLMDILPRKMASTSRTRTLHSLLNGSLTMLRLQAAVLTLLGIHSTKNEEFLFWMLMPFSVVECP